MREERIELSTFCESCRCSASELHALEVVNQSGYLRFMANPSDDDEIDAKINEFFNGFDLSEELSRTVEVMCRYDRYTGCFIPLMIEDK